MEKIVGNSASKILVIKEAQRRLGKYLYQRIEVQRIEVEARQAISREGMKETAIEKLELNFLVNNRNVGGFIY